MQSPMTLGIILIFFDRSNRIGSFKRAPCQNPDLKSVTHTLKLSSPRNPTEYQCSTQPMTIHGNFSQWCSVPSRYLRYCIVQSGQFLGLVHCATQLSCHTEGQKLTYSLFVWTHFFQHSCRNLNPFRIKPYYIIKWLLQVKRILWINPYFKMCAIAYFWNHGKILCCIRFHTR